MKKRCHCCRCKALRRAKEAERVAAGLARDMLAIRERLESYADWHLLSRTLSAHDEAMKLAGWPDADAALGIDPHGGMLVPERFVVSATKDAAE